MKLHYVTKDDALYYSAIGDSNAYALSNKNLALNTPCIQGVHDECIVRLESVDCHYGSDVKHIIGELKFYDHDMVEDEKVTDVIFEQFRIAETTIGIFKLLNNEHFNSDDIRGCYDLACSASRA